MGWRVRVYLLALVVRLLWALPVFLHPERAWDADSYDYHRLAVHLLHEHKFFNESPEIPEVFRTPGYPLFLAVAEGLGASSPRQVVLLQILLSALVPVLAFATFTRWLPEGWALAGAVVLALLPEAALFSAFLLSDTLYQVLVALGLWMLMVPEPSVPRTALGFGILALAIYVRPAGLVLVPVLALWLLGSPGSRISRSRRLLQVAVGFAVVGVLLFPWVWRNYRLTGRWLFSSAGTMNLVFSDVPYYLAHQRGKPFGREAQLEHWRWLQARTGWREPDFQGLANDPARLDQALQLTWQRLQPQDRWRFLVYRGQVALILLLHPGFRHYARLVLGRQPQSGTWAWTQAAEGRLGLLWRLAKQKVQATGPAFMLLLFGVYLLEGMAWILALLGAARWIREGRWAWVLLPVGVYILLILAAGVNMNPRFRANYLIFLVPWWARGAEEVAAWLRRPRVGFSGSSSHR